MTEALHTRRSFLTSALLAVPTAALAARYGFSTPRQKAYTFAAVGDFGTGKAEQIALGRTMGQVHSQTSFNEVLLLGDNMYGSADFKKKFEIPYQGLLDQKVQFHAVLGNHDMGTMEKQLEYDRFGMKGQRFYSFARPEANAQFFALDSNMMDAPQLKWFEQELAASKAAWKIVFFHHPPFSAGKRHGSDMRLRERLHPLLAKHGVQLVLNGHDHIYQRTKPQQGVNYFVSGAGGKVRKGDIDARDTTVAKGYDDGYHFMLFDVTADALRFRAINEKGLEIDEGEITAPGKLTTRVTTNQSALTVGSYQLFLH
jgi:predicted MPP superfamily phosphohydrolase